MVTLSVPIFSYFSYRDIEEKKVLLNQALLRAEDSELNARKEVRQVRPSYLDFVYSMKIAERQVNLAREGLKLALTAYAAGAGSSLDVTEARRAATAAEVGFITKQLESRVALLALFRGIGENMAAVGKAPRKETCWVSQGTRAKNEDLDSWTKEQTVRSNNRQRGRWQAFRRKVE